MNVYHQLILLFVILWPPSDLKNSSSWEIYEYVVVMAIFPIWDPWFMQRAWFAWGLWSIALSPLLIYCLNTICDGTDPLFEYSDRGCPVVAAWISGNAIRKNFDRKLTQKCCVWRPLSRDSFLCLSIWECGRKALPSHVHPSQKPDQATDLEGVARSRPACWKAHLRYMPLHVS